MRYRVMSILDESNNNTLYDPTSINWSSFPWVNGYYKHYTSDQEIIKPELISLLYFDSVDYVDVILLLNNIEYIWDLYPGCIIKVPKKDEIDSFIVANIK